MRIAISRITLKVPIDLLFVFFTMFIVKAEGYIIGFSECQKVDLGFMSDNIWVPGETMVTYVLPLFNLKIKIS